MAIARKTSSKFKLYRVTLVYLGQRGYTRKVGEIRVELLQETRKKIIIVGCIFEFSVPMHLLDYPPALIYVKYTIAGCMPGDRVANHPTCTNILQLSATFKSVFTLVS